MNRISAVTALVFLAGCGLSQANFQAELPRAACQWKVDCFQAYASVDACLADNPTEGMSSSCTYDSKTAKNCLDRVQALTCDNTMIDYPIDCSNVYSCPGDTGS